jgi:hypothetical protein
MMAKRNYPEQQTQRAVVEYLRILENLGELTFFHVPNGGWRSKAEAGIFKSLGVKPGVADLVLMFPGGLVAFLEIKSATGRLSASQKAFKNTAEYFGFPFAECRAVDEVERFVRGLIANPEHQFGTMNSVDKQERNA